MKHCKKCDKTLEFESFRKISKTSEKYYSYCRFCEKLYYINNKEKVLKQKKEYYNQNKELILLKVKFYQDNNKSKIKEKNKQYQEKNKLYLLEKEKNRRLNNLDQFKEKDRLYYQKNKDKIHARERKKRKTDPLFRLANNLRRRINHYLKNKSNGLENIIGLDLQNFKVYIESKFVDGMCWEKVGKEIHIDHIIPLCSAKNEDELKKLCHYTNLQPLWAKDNLKKGSKV